jgi:hypothetical protein
MPRLSPPWAEILCDRMKTLVDGEAEDGIAYNRTLPDFAAHHGFLPKACRPYRAKTKGKVERPFRYVREDFFLAGAFRSLDDLNGRCPACPTRTTGRAESRGVLSPLPVTTPIMRAGRLRVPLPPAKKGRPQTRGTQGITAASATASRNTQSRNAATFARPNAAGGPTI